MITEDDYIDYLGRSDVASSVPVALAARLRRSHFLFIGYEMVDWNLRLVMHRVWGDRPVAYRSWAVDPQPTPLERRSGAASTSTCSTSSPTHTSSCSHGVSRASA